MSNSKYYREYLTQVHRLNGIERVIAPPDLNLIVIDHNKPVSELPVVDKLTQWDLVLKIEKPPIQGKVAHS